MTLDKFGCENSALFPLKDPILGEGKREGQEKRPSFSILIAFMNLFIWGFAFDALLSVLDDGLVLIWESPFLNIPRVIVASTLVLFSFFFYFLMGLTPRIPKQIFLPMVLFTPLTVLALFPFESLLVQNPWIRLTSSLVQLLLSAAVLWRVRVLFGGLRVGAALLSKPLFSFKNLTGFSFFTLILIPFLMGYFIIWAGVAVHYGTKGFVTPGVSSLLVNQKSFIRGETIVHLVPMIHIGESNFYKSLTESFPQKSSILLREGITDRGNLIKFQFSYEKISSNLGLGNQYKDFQPAPSKIKIKNADIDASEFSKITIEILNQIGAFHKSEFKDMQVFIRLSQILQNPKNSRVFFNDVIGKRNQHLFGEIQNALRDYRHIIVPWGAFHLPQIEEAIQRQGFELGETRARSIIEYQTIYNQIFERKTIPDAKPHEN